MSPAVFNDRKTAAVAAAYEAASLVQRTEGLQGRLSLFNGLSQLFELVKGSCLERAGSGRVASLPPLLGNSMDEINT